jgi:hypothetical protein
MSHRIAAAHRGRTVPPPPGSAPRQEPRLPDRRWVHLPGLAHFPPTYAAGACECGKISQKIALARGGIRARRGGMGRHPSRSSSVDCPRGARAHLEAAAASGVGWGRMASCAPIANRRCPHEARCLLSDNGTTDERACGLRCGCCAGGRSTMIRGTCASPTVTGTRQATGTTTLVSVASGMWSGGAQAFPQPEPRRLRPPRECVLYFRIARPASEGRPSAPNSRMAPAP